MKPHEPEERPSCFATITHARLRALQGDVDGARRVLLDLLAAEPGHAEAARLLDELTTMPATPHHEPEAESASPPTSTTAEQLAASFRGALGGRRPRRAGQKVERLSALAGRIARNRGGAT